MLHTNRCNFLKESLEVVTAAELQTSPYLFSKAPAVLINLWPLVDQGISDVHGFDQSPGVLESANTMFGCGCGLDLHVYLA